MEALSRLRLAEISSRYFFARNLRTSPSAARFYESHPKGEYHEKDEDEKIKSLKQQRQNLWGIRNGFADLREEIRLWSEELQDRFGNEGKNWVVSGDRDIFWKLDSQQSLQQFDVVADSDHNEGFSKCSLTLSPTGKGLFQGYVNTTPPRDGRVKSAGYCAIKSVQPTKSFGRQGFIDWSLHTHLVMRVRGDGRSYIITIGTPGSYDLLWNDVFNYVLFTRGGPYFQKVKIPFSRFVFSSKGRVQDSQDGMLLDRVANIGISAGKVDGPFSLEIDYIGVECDPAKDEASPYETYRIPKYMSGV